MMGTAPRSICTFLVEAVDLPAASATEARMRLRWLVVEIALMQAAVTSRGATLEAPSPEPSEPPESVLLLSPSAAGENPVPTRGE